MVAPFKFGGGDVLIKHCPCLGRAGQDRATQCLFLFLFLFRCFNESVRSKVDFADGKQASVAAAAERVKMKLARWRGVAWLRVESGFKFQA